MKKMEKVNNCIRERQLSAIIMATTANIKILNLSKPKQSFTPKKTAHLNPIKRKMLKTAAEEYLPMALQPPPEAESVQQYAISLTGSGKMGNTDDSVKEMWQICKNLDEYTKDLENVYEKSNEKVTAQTSYMDRQFFSFLSTCDSATRELDTTINVEHKILESLYQDYQEEAQLLEELGAEDITADRDILASHDKVTALICKLMELLYKLSFKNLSKTGKTRGRPHIQGPDITSDHSPQLESLIRALRELMAAADIRSKEGMERIIHDVGELFAVQAMELQKLGKDQEETENKYIKVKRNFQVLLQEKKFLEIELRKLLAWRAGQNSPPMLSPGLEEILEKAQGHILSIVTDSDTTLHYRSDEELEKVAKLFGSQDKATIQGKVAPPADSPVSSLHKKPKMQKEGNMGFSEIEDIYDLEHWDMGTSSNIEPYGDMVETKINGVPESKNEFTSLNTKEETARNEKKGKMKKQKLKSQKRRGRRPNADSSKEKMADQDDRKSSKTTIEKLDNKNVQKIPEMVHNLKKSVTKLPRTPSSLGKGKAKLDVGDSMTAVRSGVQSQRDKESDPREQQMRPSGAEPSKSVGKQLGRRQSLRSKPRHRSEEKLELHEQSQKDPPGKLQITKENQHEKQIENQEVRDNRSFQDQPQVHTEGNRCFPSGPGLSRTASPDQESLTKDDLGPNREDPRGRSGTGDTDAIAQYSGEGHALEDTLSPSQVSQKTFLSADSAFTQTDPSGVSPYPPPTIQIQHPEDTEDTTTGFRISRKMPDKADKETAQSGNQPEPAMTSGDDARTQYRQSPWKYEASDLWQDLDDELHEFPQSFESELCIQGRSISFKHSTENSSRTPSQRHLKQRGEQRKPLYRKRVTRNIPSEHSILSTLTVKGIGRGVTSTWTPSEKMHSSTFKEEPRKTPDQSRRDYVATDYYEQNDI